MWQIGDRVLAHRAADGYWYPATIRHLDGERYYIIGDDGEDALVQADQLRELRLEVGDRVWVRSRLDRSYTPGRVTEVLGETLRVRYDSQEEEWAALSLVRLEPEAPKPAAIEPTSLEPGNRVLACAPDLFWYPGVVFTVNGERIHVLFDGGGQAVVTPDRIRPLHLDVGDTVQCRWQAGPEFLPATITRRDGERIEVRYDDDEEEATLMHLVRLNRDDWLPENNTVTVAKGDHVLGCWADGYWYPGTVLSIDGKRIHVLFDDGDQLVVTPAQVRRLDLDTGDRVQCRWQGGPLYYPGTISRKDGDTIHVQYDDGDEETTTIRLVRVE